MRANYCKSVVSVAVVAVVAVVFSNGVAAADVVFAVVVVAGFFFCSVSLHVSSW